MSIHIIKSKVTALGYMAYEPKYKREAIFIGGRFFGWKKREEVRSMIACGRTQLETLLKAISRRIKCQ